MDMPLGQGNLCVAGHLTGCNGFNELVSLDGVPDCFNGHPTLPYVSFKDLTFNEVYNNF